MKMFWTMVVVVGLAVSCSDKKPSPSKGESGLGAKRVGAASSITSKDRGPLTDSEKESLKDCGEGTWLHGEGSVTKLDSDCGADDYATVMTSEKFRHVVDAIIFEGHLWVIADFKDHGLHVVRFDHALDELEEFDEAHPMALYAGEDGWRMVESHGFVAMDGILWVVGRLRSGNGAWIPVNEHGVGEPVPGRGNVVRPFRSGGRIWSANTNSSFPLPAGQDLSNPSPEMTLVGETFGKLYGEMRILSTHGKDDSVVLSVEDRSSHEAQLRVFDSKTMALKRTIELPFVLDNIVVAHGYVWGLALEQHKVVRIPVEAGALETVMVVAKPEDHFSASIAADDSSVWLHYKGDTWDSGLIRFDASGRPTGFVGHVTEDADTFFSTEPI